MTTWIGAAIATAAVTFAISGLATTASAAAPAKPTTLTADSQRAVDFGPRRYHRRDDRHGYRTYSRPQPHYYARPYYYRPYPYSVPAPFTFGFGFGPGWW